MERGSNEIGKTKSLQITDSGDWGLLGVFLEPLNGEKLSGNGYFSSNLLSDYMKLMKGVFPEFSMHALV